MLGVVVDWGVLNGCEFTEFQDALIAFVEEKVLKAKTVIPTLKLVRPYMSVRPIPYMTDHTYDRYHIYNFR